MRNRGLFGAAALLAACIGCNEAPRASETVPAAAQRLRFTIEDFRTLHWLEGDWKGAMANGSFFFESYRLLNDSTIQMYAHADSTMGAPTDSSRIYFRDGTIYAGPQTAVDRIDEDGVHFSPLGAAGNTFVWKSTGADSWTATLGADGQVTYHMTRFRR